MTITALVALGALVSWTNAHFTTGHLIVNGTDTGLWKHVLKVAAPDGSYGGYDLAGMVTPLYADQYLSTTNITCGRAAFKMLEQTDIADVVAGEEIGFRTLNTNDLGGVPEGGVTHFYHPGPAQVWLSRAPNDDLRAYHGDGDWFKVAYAGPIDDQNWELWRNTDEVFKPKTDYNFTLPRNTPPGAYLLRFEYIFPTSYNYTQFFVNCALVNIHAPDPPVGPGTPTGFAKFPGAYEIDDPGLLVPFTQDLSVGLPKEQLRLTEYKAPGPVVWKG